jgi:hypothetical protein
MAEVLLYDQKEIVFFVLAASFSVIMEGALGWGYEASDKIHPGIPTNIVGIPFYISFAPFYIILGRFGLKGINQFIGSVVIVGLLYT